MSKEILEGKKSALQLLLSENDDKATDYKAQIAVIDQELEDLVKPEATPEFLDKINETICEAVENLDLDDGINYDGRVSCDSHEFRNSDDLVQMVHEKVCELFKETEEKEDK